MKMRVKGWGPKIAGNYLIQIWEEKYLLVLMCSNPGVIYHLSRQPVGRDGALLFDEEPLIFPMNNLARGLAWRPRNFIG
jgi:hypothetical protein